MCGSSASDGYGSGGSEWAIDVLLQRVDRTVQPEDRTSARRRGASRGLADRQHPIERDLRPVLAIVGHDDAVVDDAVDQPFEGPEQMVRRDAEHRRAEAAELIERQYGPLGRDLARQPVHE